MSYSRKEAGLGRRIPNWIWKRGLLGTACFALFLRNLRVRVGWTSAFAGHPCIGSFFETKGRKGARGAC